MLVEFSGLFFRYFLILFQLGILENRRGFLKQNFHFKFCRFQFLLAFSGIQFWGCLLDGQDG